MSSLSEFSEEFGIQEEQLGPITKLNKRYFLTLLEQEGIIEKKKKELFGVGVFLGEEKKKFEPTPALLELISSKTAEHKAVVDEKAEWLFLCGRDLFEKAVEKAGTTTKSGYLLVENEQGENLGYGVKSKQKNIAIKNLLDRGFYLRRER